MQFEAVCQEVRRMPGDDVRYEASFLVDAGSDWPGFLIIRILSTEGLKLGSKVLLTLEAEYE